MAAFFLRGAAANSRTRFNLEKEKTVNRTAQLFLCVLLIGSLTAIAQSPAATGQAAKSPTAQADTAVNPVAEVRQARSWEYGPFVNYGVGIGDRSSYKFLSGGFQVGKAMTPVLHAGPLSGQFELSGNIMPLWQAYTPSAHMKEYVCNENGVLTACNLLVGGGTFRGVSITPAIFRWNFLTKSRRIQPWFQGAGGLIYTTHKFPPNFMSTQTIDNQTVYFDGGTSVWNFTPQGGVGLHYFTRSKRSIDLGINAVHISSASLGDKNPGVNASIQFQVGYTFWK